MAPLRILTVLVAFGLAVVAQKPQYPPAFPATPVLESAAYYAPSVTPTVQDLLAPNAQVVCPGYKASNVVQDAASLTADLTLAGKACNAYGNDIQNLVLSVQYQSQERLAVRIFPKYLSAQNRSQHILSGSLTPLPQTQQGASAEKSNLKFVYTNNPTFQFQVQRAKTNEVLFSTYGSKIVYEDQFLELVTTMQPDYNVYGLAENLRAFRIPNTFTQTFWNAYNLNNDQEIGVNGHSVHPMYLETRYGKSGSTSHGVYARNAHGQEWLMRPSSITYRTIGGSFDMYFLSGSTPKEVISQYQVGIVKTPVLQPYWALGFWQNRWGYQNWTNLQDVLDLYAQQNIQIEGIMNDLDYLYMNRIFTNSPGHYDLDEGKRFLDRIHSRGQYYLPILDPNVYVPDPSNATDVYPTYNRGDKLGIYLRNGKDSYYVGIEWPGFSVFPDFLMPQAQSFWTDEIKRFHDLIDFDGFWLDVSDPVSYCTSSCGQGRLTDNPIHVPFPLPGDANSRVAVDFRYPEQFILTNVTEAASASVSLVSQTLRFPTNTPTPTPVLPRTKPTPGVRNLNFPPYNINNFLPGHSLVAQVVSPNATHNDGPYNSTEYELHNLYGHLSGNATYNALLAARPGRRPFFIARSTFAGSGAFAGHWGGDTNSKWGNMYYGISQALQNSIAGIPYFGVETCGFNGNADLQLCTRWMQLSAWFPMYRNHNNRNTIAQEAYRWATNAESTRRIMNIRYSLLPYTYTLFHQANKAGETVLRALAWEFPDDPQLRAVETQFMSGPAILVTPVLGPDAMTVRGVFPGVGSGTVWYDWYTLVPVQAAAGENKTLDAPILHQPIHVRGGYVIPMQKAGNTTATSRKSPWSLLVALDGQGQAQGDLYLDDGISQVQKATKEIQIQYSSNKLTTNVSGSFNDNLPLANLTVAGIRSRPRNVAVTLNGRKQDTRGIKLDYSGNTLRLTGLEEATQPGVWTGALSISLS